MRDESELIQHWLEQVRAISSTINMPSDYPDRVQVVEIAPVFNVAPDDKISSLLVRGQLVHVVFFSTRSSNNRRSRQMIMPTVYILVQAETGDAFEALGSRDARLRWTWPFSDFYEQVAPGMYHRKSR